VSDLLFVTKVLNQEWIGEGREAQRQEDVFRIEEEKEERNERWLQPRINCATPVLVDRAGLAFLSLLYAALTG